MDSVVTIRVAVYADIPHLLELARHVDRVTGCDEIGTWMQFDPYAMIVAECPTAKKVIGCCCGLRLSPSLGFMAFYAVHESYRKQGIGKRLWDRAFGRLRNHNVGVWGLPHNFQKYEESYGFRLVVDHTFMGYECAENNKLRTAVVTLMHGMSVATIFEGRLVNVESNNELRKINSIQASFEKTGNKYALTTRKEFEKLAEDKIVSILTSGTSSIENYSPQDSVFPDDTGVSLRTEDSSDSLVKMRESASLLKNENECNLTKINKKTLLITDVFEVEKGCLNNCTTKPIDKLSGATSLCNSRADVASAQIFEPVSNSQVTFKTEEVRSSHKDAATSLNSVEALIEGVLEYDQCLHKRDLSFVMRETLFWKGCTTKVAFVSNSVVGYGCLRRSVTSHWIVSPLYADSFDVAELLLVELLRDFDFSEAPRGVMIYTPVRNSGFREFIQKIGFIDIGICVSNGYTKNRIDMKTSKIFSLSSWGFCA